MTDGLRPYPEYKDSGLPWLGKMPAHWDVRRNGRLFAQRNETGFGDLPILEVSLKTGVRVRDMENLKRKQVMSDRDKYKRAVKGDIAYNMMRMWQGAVGAAPVDGLVSPAYVVAQPYPETDTRYFSYLFRTGAYMAEVDGYSRGIVKDRNRLYWQDFKRMPSCFPPSEEQSIIADYLDANAALVRKFVRNRRRLIEVLDEQKQATIDRAFTGRLDPAVPLKPSGINWLGDVPAHWDIRRLRQVAALRVSNVDKHTKEGEIPVRLCNYTDVYKNAAITADMPFMAATATSAEIRAFHLNVGDVIITKDSEDWQDIGVPALVTETAEDVVCGYHLAILRPKSWIAIGRFLAYVMQCRAVVVQLSIAANGVTRYGLSHGAIKAIRLPVPPIDEQEPIAGYIDDATSTLNEAIQCANREIDLIHEYRTRLIADVVTGKLDVRHLAPPPDSLELDESDTIDAEEALDDEFDGEDESDLAEEAADADD
jgi:type I restriction enzyme, S subunit